MEASIKFIGEIQSPLKRIEECPLQENENAPEASITIFPEFIEGIKDIKVNTEILILTWLHKAGRAVLKCKPRNYTDVPEVGVFSTRSPDRPNPIGVHVAKVLSISKDGVIKVTALEALDKTPVIDIKPVINKSHS